MLQRGCTARELFANPGRCSDFRLNGVEQPLIGSFPHEFRRTQLARVLYHAGEKRHQLILQDAAETETLQITGGQDCEPQFVALRLGLDEADAYGRTAKG